MENNIQTINSSHWDAAKAPLPHVHLKASYLESFSQDESRDISVRSENAMQIKGITIKLST